MSREIFPKRDGKKNEMNWRFVNRIRKTHSTAGGWTGGSPPCVDAACADRMVNLFFTGGFELS